MQSKSMAKELTAYDDDPMMDTMITTMFMVMAMVVAIPVVLNIAQTTIATQGVLALGLNEPYEVTAKTTVQEARFTQAMQSMSVKNDGAATAYIKVNTLNTQPNVVNPGETFEVSYNTHAIERVFYYTVSGETKLRITGAG